MPWGQSQQISKHFGLQFFHPALHRKISAIENAETNEHSRVRIKLYLQKQVKGQIQPKAGSLLAPTLEERNFCFMKMHHEQGKLARNELSQGLRNQIRVSVAWILYAMQSKRRVLHVRKTFLCMVFS